VVYKKTRKNEGFVPLSVRSLSARLTAPQFLTGHYDFAARLARTSSGSAGCERLGQVVFE
jgi:hypothetical protein